MKIAVLTLGCRTNQAESAQIEQTLQALGHRTVEKTVDAEICIINTCSVTAKADYQSRQLISRAVNSGAEVIVTGCYSELNNSLINAKNKGIKIVRNKDKHRIINIIAGLNSSVILNNIEIKKHRPIIKVQDGCNNECSYCIVPIARGRSISIRPEEVIERVLFYESLGFEEVVLSGIHMGIYGRDLNPMFDLAKLLQLLISKTAIRRIRLSSIEINELTDELMEVLADQRICRHLHLPLQSGDDNILSRMSRSYNSSEYIRAINNVFSIFNNMSVGTDIIVGFPGEGESQFQNTVSIMQSIEFSYLHVFPYSSRLGTKASLMKDNVIEFDKKRHVQIMLTIGKKKKMDFLKYNIGIDHEIIIESCRNNVITGTTSNYIKVRVPTDASLSPGRLVGVRITGIEGQDAVGFPLRSAEPLDK